MSTSFAILVTGSPTSSQAHVSALRFVKAALALQHSIASIFFYQEATHVANKLICKPTDETNFGYQWVDLASNNQIELQVCIAAANRRGIISPEEAEMHHFVESNLHDGFTVVGLGQLAVALNQTANKFVQFK